MTTTLIHGDALQELRRFPDRSFACVVTSPPYNIGHNNEKAGQPDSEGFHHRWQGQYPGDFDDLLDPEEYIAYHRAVLGELLRVMQPEGLCWWVHRRRPHPTGQEYPGPVDRILAGFAVRSEIIWHKTGGGTFNLPTGGKKDCPVNYPANRYETIFMLPAAPSGRMDRDVAKETDVWPLRKERVKGHPATFPVELAARCIAGTSAQGPVLDPFMGTGSTALAALAAGRDCTGIELAEETLEIARRRLDRAGQSPKLI